MISRAQIKRNRVLVSISFTGVKKLTMARISGLGNMEEKPYMFLLRLVSSESKKYIIESCFEWVNVR